MTRNEHCFLSHFGKPEAYLSPLKYEQLNSSPLVGMFHDFVSETQTQALKEACQMRLKTTPLHVQNEIHEFTELRTSKVAYFNDQDHPVAKKLSRRIEMALNFNLATEYHASENYQIMNYGVGGNIVGHLDSVGKLDSIFSRGPLKLLVLIIYQSLSRTKNELN